MKTKIALLLLLSCRSLLAGDVTSSATPTKKPACCSACDREDKVSTVEAAMMPLTKRSLYQAEGSWTNDRGESFALASLRGHPVVLAMFFTSCEYACPVTVSDMQRLRGLLPVAVREQARFVLVSFDPARDTPAALKAYRDRVALDEGWTLLHGDATSVQELAMLLGVKYKQDTRGQFSHSNLITVLNNQGEIAYQRAGLMGDVSEAARAVSVAAQAGQVAVK